MLMAWISQEFSYFWKWVLAFIMLSLHICAPENGVHIIQPIEVNVNQKSYQAERNHNITLDFTFTIKPVCFQTFWLVLCEQIKDGKVLYQYVEDDGKKVSETQDETFSGRVQMDKDVLREGRIRLHVSRLKMEDSGDYICKLNIGDCRGSDKFNLTVTDSHPSELPATVSTPAENWGRIISYIVPAIVAVILLIICCYFKIKRTMTTKEERSERAREQDRSDYVSL